MGTSAIDLSNSLAAAVERAGPSVVRVDARRAGAASGIVWSSDGIIVTASHGLEWDEGIVVALPEGGTTAAALAGRDATTDIAALRVSASALRVPTWSDSSTVKVGHLVLAISRPGRSARASLGVVSACGESWRTPAGGRVDRYIQTDVSLHVGFSGGLLVDASGNAIGLNTAGLLRRTALAVPVETVRRVVDALLAHGQVRRGYLGIGTYPVRLPLALEQQLGQPSGLLVLSVQPDSPAARAGLVLGDTLVALEGRPVTQPEELLPFLEESYIGREVATRILRAGEVRDVTVVVGARDAKAA
jgi:S1-C subfamily serine protease